ncbi:hypothetical protein NliqN6_4976 [Naganishia liquefaciens]|uniref:Uncharacterized protein n=1 Tax=Naganishia liquefaciens TaxID=104408 RepID=A0A8H3TWW1_9TREE|nr:hypothetical protein NliqN6_4976 [Naganishia liquefaciens]
MRQASAIQPGQDEARMARRASWGNQDAEDDELARMAAEAGRRRSSSETKVAQVEHPRIPPSFAFPQEPQPLTPAPPSPPPPRDPAPFSFGTFRMNSPAPMLGTPTTELASFFEYPLDPVSPAIRRLVANEQIDQPSSLLAPQGFSPALRRTSSTSTVPVSPAGGRRPSVVHSNTASQAEAAQRFSLAATEEDAGETYMTTTPVAGPSASPTRDAPIRRPSDTSSTAPRPAAASSPFPARRSSILGFAHQPLPDAPVPPSLANRVGTTPRRGSISAQQILPLESRDRRQSSIWITSSSLRSATPGGGGARTSFSGSPVTINPGTQDEHTTVSTAYLYQRRASLASTSRGLLSSNAPPATARPPIIPQRQGSVSSVGSSSRESIATLRDTTYDLRPGNARRSSSQESSATVRRMSMPALASPEATEAASWHAQGALRMSLGGQTEERAPGGLSCPAGQAGSRVTERAFTLGQVPGPRGQGVNVKGWASPGERSPRRESSDSETPNRAVRTSHHAICSSSEELSDTMSDPPSASDRSSSASSSADPNRRGFRLSQRAIEARERRRSSRLSTFSSSGAGTALQTIPSEAVVVDFAEARSARSSAGGTDAHDGPRRGIDVSVASVTDEGSPVGGDKIAGGETSAEAITTAFRAFAFPPRR